MTTTTKYDNRIYDNLCAAINSLSAQNRFAFAPFLSPEEHSTMAKSTVFGDYKAGYKALVSEDPNLQSFTYDDCKDVVNISLKDIINYAFDPSYLQRHGEPWCLNTCQVYGYHQLNDTQLTDLKTNSDLMSSIIHKAADQMSECLGINNTRLTFAFSYQDYCHRRGVYSYNDLYEIHRDVRTYVEFERVEESRLVALTLTLKGKGTAFFADDYKKGDALYEKAAEDAINTPELHLSVFTQGYKHGATHSAPAYMRGENCERFVVILVGAKAVDEAAVEESAIV